MTQNQIVLEKVHFKAMNHMLSIISSCAQDAAINEGSIYCFSPQGTMIGLSYDPINSVTIDIAGLANKTKLFDILIGKDKNDQSNIVITKNDSSVIFTDMGSDLSITTPANVILSGAYTLTKKEYLDQLEVFNKCPVLCTGDVTPKLKILNGVAKAINLCRIDLIKEDDNLMFRMGSENTAVIKLMDTPLNMDNLPKGRNIDTDTKCDHLQIPFTDVQVTCSLKVLANGHELITCKWDCVTEEGIRMTVINDSPLIMVR
jgi:hypothetical protein